MSNILTTPLIGIVGRAGAGKDTVCDMAIDILVRNKIEAQKIALATPIKEICTWYSQATGVPPTAFTGTKTQKNTVYLPLKRSGRVIQQRIGDALREEYENLFIDLAIEKAMPLINTGVRAVFFSDIRRYNEAAAIKRQGGVIVRIKNPTVDVAETQGLKNHPSETEVSSISYDFVINNEGRSLVELREHVENLLCELQFLPSTPKPLG